jgi:dipeptidyl aminopeptidase/acylaminoacyl peptidase
MRRTLLLMIAALAGWQPPPRAQAPAAPPDTEIFLAAFSARGQPAVARPVNITHTPGYDNQPSFTSDGASIYFTSNRGASQTDIYRYDTAAETTARVTDTPEGEYSPTVTPDGRHLSVIRVEADGTQRLWQFTLEGTQPALVLERVKPVGYHAWADDHTLALFVLGGNGAPSTLQIADTRTGAARVAATDIGRSLQRMPGPAASRHVSFVQRERSGDRVSLVIKELDPATGAITTLTPSVEGSREADLAWTPDGTLLMAKDDVLYAWKAGQSGWKEVSSLQQLSLRGVTRLAVSPKGDFLALVAAAPVSSER